MSAFVAEALVKRYGANVALDGVDISVEEGELVGLLGPNGAGKSTLTKIGCGLVKPDGGGARVCGEAAGSRAARAALGYLAELFRFPGWLTASEVLELHGRLEGATSRAERDELLGLVGLGDVGGRRVEQMSKGMQQRLGIAQALIGRPRVLLLDEPTSALDPAGRRIVRDILDDVRRRGIGVLLNSHLLGEVELVCDRVVIIARGKVVAEGSPSGLASSHGVEIETEAGNRRFPTARRADVPELVARLVAEGASIYAVRTVKPTLEDIYLAAVEGEIG
jgi:ABC-2 type transport system ATP-binding protein